MLLILADFGIQHIPLFTDLAVPGNQHTKMSFFKSMNGTVHGAPLQLQALIGKQRMRRS